MNRTRLGALLFVLAACDQVEPVEEESATIPRSVQDAFTRSCAVTGCHVAGHITGIDLTPEGAPAILDQTYDGRPVVVIGDPNASAMGLALMHEPPSDVVRMPYTRDDLSLTDGAIVLAWISGAEMPDSVVEPDAGSGG
jgi:hypothetical protein